MTQKEKIQKEIEDTLQSLDGIQKAVANPYLFTRIKARMQKQEASIWERTFSFMSKPAVAFAVVLLVMAINGWSFFGGTSTPPAKVGGETADLGLPEFESEYKLITSTESYDYENFNNQ